MNREKHEGYSEILEDSPPDSFAKDLFYIAMTTSGGSFPDQRNEVKLLREFYNGKEEIYPSTNDDTVKNR